MQLSNKHRIHDVKPFGRRFEGYHFADSADGRSRHIYTGEYYRKCLPDRTVRRQKLLYSGLSVISVLLFCLGGALPVRSNSTGVSVLAGCCELLLYLWLMYIMVVLVSRQRKLTIWGYRVTALQLEICAAALALAQAFSFVYTLVYSLVRDNGAAPVCALACMAYLLSSVPPACVAVMEARTPYDVEFPD